MASVKRRPDGRWRARYRDPTGKEHAKHEPTRAKAERWLRAQLAALEHGSWVDPAHGRTLFAEFAQRWTKAQLQHRGSTAEATASRMKHLTAAFGERRLSSISQVEVQGWVSGLSARGLSPGYVGALYRQLATILGAAAKARVIAVSPCHDINLPEVAPARIRVPSVGELEAITAGLPGRYRRVVPTVMGTGLRFGEVAGLTVDRVDWLRRLVTVDRQWQRGFTPPKTKKSHRVIPVGEHTVGILTAQVAEFGEGPHRLIFTNTKGRPLVRSTWGEAWAKTSPGGLTLHDARHFFASLLIRQGLSVRVVQERMGHASPNETLGTYGHLWADDDDRTRDAVDDVLFGTLGPSGNGGVRGLYAD